MATNSLTIAKSHTLKSLKSWWLWISSTHALYALWSFWLISCSSLPKPHWSGIYKSKEIMRWRQVCNFHSAKHFKSRLSTMWHLLLVWCWIVQDHYSIKAYHLTLAYYQSEVREHKLVSVLYKHSHPTWSEQQHPGAYPHTWVAQHWLWRLSN